MSLIRGFVMVVSQSLIPGLALVDLYNLRHEVKMKERVTWIEKN